MKHADKIVTVYQDPITEQEPEGEARLIRKLDERDPSTGLERWKVRFTDDGFVTSRFIRTKEGRKERAKGESE